MKIEKLIPNSYSANSYIVIDEPTKEALIIDPSESASEILKHLSNDGLKLKFIVLTHTHPDHIGAVAEIKAATGAELLMHANEAGSRMMSGRGTFAGVKLPEADRNIQDGDKIMLGSIKTDVLHTPGHTQGGICLLADGVLFSGDTLFNSSIGRSDFPGGNGPQLLESIHSKLMTLPADTVVLPGHGTETTIGNEKQFNPFLKR